MSTVLCLRTCNADMTSHGGFVWPTSGPVACDDFDPSPVCGGGLHGLLWGEGAGALLNFAPDAVWLVFEAAADSVVELNGKIKVPSATVVKCGDRHEVTAWLAERAPGRAIVGASVTAGDRGTATAGYCGTATAGYCGTATAGDDGTATAGDRGTATAGGDGTATAGDDGTATAGDRGTATAGYGGTATAGDCGTATAGAYGAATADNCGTATAGAYGTATAGAYGTATAGAYGAATAGNCGTATVGDCGTATAGYRGSLLLRHWTGGRYVWKAGNIGLDTDAAGELLRPNVAYRLNAAGKFVRAAA